MDNLSFGDKLVAVKDKCDDTNEVHDLCRTVLGKNIISGEDMDICFKENNQLKRLKRHFEKCVNDFFPN